MVCVNCLNELLNLKILKVIKLSLTKEEFPLCGDCFALLPKRNVRRQDYDKPDEMLRLYEPVLMFDRAYCNINNNFCYLVKPKLFTKYLPEAILNIKTMIQDDYNNFFKKF
jgi:hypothetical protein